MLDTTNEAVMCDRWLASAVALENNKWAMAGTTRRPRTSVQIEGGQVRIQAFDNGWGWGRGHYRGVDWFKVMRSLYWQERWC